MAIVVVGDIFVDVKGYPFETYNPKGRNAGKIVEVIGGVSYNVTMDLAYLKAKPIFVSLVEDSGVGKMAMQSLVDNDVNTSHIRLVENGMGTWLAIFDEKGDVAGSISKRPNVLPLSRILEEDQEQLMAACSSIALQLDLEGDVVDKAFEIGGQYNKPIHCVVSNITLAMQKRHLLSQVASFTCNQEEAGQFFNLDMQHIEPKDLVALIQREGIQNMIVTLGKDGAMYASMNGDCGHVPAKDVVVVDTTGAGDAFFSGIVYGLDQGWSLKETCTHATSLSARVIQSTDNYCK